MSSDWDESIILDMDHLEAYTGGDQTVAQKALAVFSMHAPEYLALLKEADAENWSARAHKLKGAARGLGAWRLAKQGERAEFLNDPMLDAEGRSACLEELDVRLDELLDHIKAL